MTGCWWDDCDQVVFSCLAAFFGWLEHEYVEHEVIADLFDDYGSMEQLWAQREGLA